MAANLNSPLFAPVIPRSAPRPVNGYLIPEGEQVDWFADAVTIGHFTDGSKLVALGLSDAFGEPSYDGLVVRAEGENTAYLLGQMGKFGALQGMVQDDAVLRALAHRYSIR